MTILRGAALAAFVAAGAAAGPAAAPAKALYPIHSGAKIAFIDGRGRVAVPARFDVADAFSEGLARVAVQKGENLVQGFLDTTGKLVVELPYAAVFRFSEGLARVRSVQGRFDQYGYVDRAGKLVIPAQFVQARDFKDGRAWVQTDPEQPAIWIDKKGRRLPGLAGDGELSFQDGLAVSEIEGLCGYIDPKGKAVVPVRYPKALPFTEGLALAGEPGKWDLLDPAGKVLATLPYANVRSFKEGLARVSVGEGKAERWGFVDKTGRLVIATEFDYAADFSEGLAAIEAGGKWGFVDKAGKRVIPPRFDNASSFENGLARIEEGRCSRDQPAACRAGYVDPAGKVVWEPGRRYLGGLGGSVLVPAGWTAEERGKELRLTLDPAAAGTRYPLVVLLRRHELGKALSLEQALEKLSTELTASGRKFKRLELSDRKVDGIPAKLHGFSSDRMQPFEPELTVKAVQLLAIKDAALYNLVGLAEVDEFLRNRERLQAILESFRVEIAE